MKISKLIKILTEKFNTYGDMDVTIDVPGDDPGYWPIESDKQIKVSKYVNTEEHVLEIEIY